jgi:hypothetical protein
MELDRQLFAWGDYSKIPEKQFGAVCETSGNQRVVEGWLFHFALTQSAG